MIEKLARAMHGHDVQDGVTAEPWEQVRDAYVGDAAVLLGDLGMKYHAFAWYGYEGNHYEGAFDTQEEADRTAGEYGYVFYGIKTKGDDE